MPAAPKATTTRRLYGRRKGRPLRPGRERLLRELLPRLKIVPDKPIEDPAALFEPRAREVWLEIGFGGGEHLAWQAAKHPSAGLIGAEIFINGVASLLKRIEEDCLANVRIFEGDGRDLLDLLPAASIQKAFILFPDPWPKLRHAKRRIVQAKNLDRLAAALAPGAELRIATDDPSYQTWVLAELFRHPAFEWLVEGPGDWREKPADWPDSRYEEKALTAGRRPLYLRYRRRAKPREST